MTRDITRRIRGQKKDWLDRCFERTRSLQNTHGQRIDWLKSESDSLYRQMGDAFERSKSAYGMRDHAGASSWGAQGRQFQARLREANAEKGRLIEIMKAAQAEFAKARDDYRKAKDEDERAKEKFNERLAYLKQQSAKERATKRSEREAKAKQRQTARELAHANRERRRSAIEQRRSEFIDIARRRSRRLNTTSPRDIQAQDDDVYVKVKNGYDRRSDEYTTDIIIAYRDKRIPFHHHFVIDEQGRVVIDEKRQNR